MLTALSGKDDIELRAYSLEKGWKEHIDRVLVHCKNDSVILLTGIVISTALAVLFTLVDSGIDVLVVVLLLLSGDSFDCSKLLNRVEPITQTRPEEKTKTKRDKKEKMEKREKREKMEKMEKKEKKEKNL